MNEVPGKKCIFVSDLHGKTERYEILFRTAAKELPDAVFIGGDILPGGYGKSMDPEVFWESIINGISRARKSKPDMRFFVIFGNDDPKTQEKKILTLQADGWLEYVHMKSVKFGNLNVAGYSYVPPSPFLLKDWEKYDVSRFTGVGAVSPEEGIRTVDVLPEIVKYSTIDEDLRELAALSDPKRTVYLFHSPPYETCLDRVDSDGKFIDHAPADTHVGSIAIRRFLERKEPFLTLHGHIHESVRLTGNWRERFGSTHVFGASHDGPGLAVVRFDVTALENVRRDVILQ